MTSFDCEILLVIVLRPAVMLFTGADLGGFVQRNCIKKNETSRHHDLASKRRKSHFKIFRGRMPQDSAVLMSNPLQ